MKSFSAYPLLTLPRDIQPSVDVFPIVILSSIWGQSTINNVKNSSTGCVLASRVEMFVNS